jgi:hypothetical protein
LDTGARGAAEVSNLFAISGSLVFGFVAACSAGGADRIRTDDPLLAKQVLSQLSYSPDRQGVPAKASGERRDGGPGRI